MKRGRRLVSILLAAGLCAPAVAQLPPPQGPSLRDRSALLLSQGLRYIPSSNMAPALEAGDYVRFDTGAYASAPPQRGDIVVIRHPYSEHIMVSRVIGLPGDRVQMKQGRLFLNRAMIERARVKAFTWRSPDKYTLDVTVYSEHLPGEAAPHQIYEVSDSDRLDETPEFVVPADRFFLMGDHRDNSEDSRAPCGYPKSRQTPEWTCWSADTPSMGMVPRGNILGRASEMTNFKGTIPRGTFRGPNQH